jgi:hypothetical protein
MIIYCYNLKIDFTKKHFWKYIALCIMNTIKSNGKKYNGNFLLPFKNWLSLVISITKCGVISTKESAHTNEKK